MAKWHYSFCFFMITLWCCTPNQKLTTGSPMSMPADPGKCYAKCPSSDQKEIRQITYMKYVGDDTEIINKYVQDQVIELMPVREAWEKRQSSGCPTGTPKEDCLVWCKVQIPATELLLDNVLLDTTVTKDFEVEHKTAWVVVKSGGSVDWVEVICESDITTKLINQLSKSLVSKGYLKVEDSIHNTMTQTFKDALTNFQKDQGLYYGTLTAESAQLLLNDNSSEP